MKQQKIVHVAVIGLLMAAAVAMAAATSLELLLRLRSYWRDRRAQTVSRPVFDALLRAYAPFTVEELHPQYFFFFPLDPGERAAIANKTCSVDADGFRGAGPAHAGGRRLAFLLGGSAAFGLFSSSDDSTIAGYLNRLQDDYFFVNSGVPGWNSMQELYRVALQILDYQPALVVTLDGSNDAVLLDEYQQNGPERFPIGAPMHFDELSAIVREQGANRQTIVRYLWTRLFPELKTRVDRWRGRASAGPPPGADPDADGPPLPDAIVQSGAARYLANEARMRDLVSAHGGRFVAVFQPVTQLHRHVAPGPPLGDWPVIHQFHRAVMTQYAHDFELHDESAAFDREYPSVPVMTKDLATSTIFIDEVHLNDLGNEIMARHLAQLLRLRCRGPACS